MTYHRLVRLIEAHSNQLANELLARVQESRHLPSFSKVPAYELKERVYEIYKNLGHWLTKRTEADIERQYCEIGARRRRQGVPLSELIWAITLTKENLWDYLTRESCPGFELEVLAEHDLFRMIDRFFNYAVYYAARGYEHVAAVEQPAEHEAVLALHA